MYLMILICFSPVDFRNDWGATHEAGEEDFEPYVEEIFFDGDGYPIDPRDVADYLDEENFFEVEPMDTDCHEVITETIGEPEINGKEYDLEFEHSYDFKNMSEEELLALGGLSGIDPDSGELVEFETYDLDLFEKAVESELIDDLDAPQKEEEGDIVEPQEAEEQYIETLTAEEPLKPDEIWEDNEELYDDTKFLADDIIAETEMEEERAT